MQSLEQYLKELNDHKRDLELRLAGVIANIEAISKQQIGFPQGPQPPSLDSMRTRDAVNVYLGWRREQEMAPATLGELEKELARHKVVSFRNQPMSDMRFPWKSLCNALGSPDNERIWHIERHDPDGHFSRADTIELKSPKKKS
jgi:hypothetical protein